MIISGNAVLSIFSPPPELQGPREEESGFGQLLTEIQQMFSQPPELQGIREGQCGFGQLLTEIEHQITSLPDPEDEERRALESVLQVLGSMFQSFTPASLAPAVATPGAGETGVGSLGPAGGPAPGWPPGLTPAAGLGETGHATLPPDLLLDASHDPGQPTLPATAVSPEGMQDLHASLMTSPTTALSLEARRPSTPGALADLPIVSTPTAALGIPSGATALDIPLSFSGGSVLATAERNNPLPAPALADSQTTDIQRPPPPGESSPAALELGSPVGPTPPAVAGIERPPPPGESSPAALEVGSPVGPTPPAVAGIERPPPPGESSPAALELGSPVGPTPPAVTGIERPQPPGESSPAALELGSPVGPTQPAVTGIQRPPPPGGSSPVALELGSPVGPTQSEGAPAAIATAGAVQRAAAYVEEAPASLLVIPQADTAAQVGADSYGLRTISGVQEESPLAERDHSPAPRRATASKNGASDAMPSVPYLAADSTLSSPLTGGTSHTSSDGSDTSVPSPSRSLEDVMDSRQWPRPGPANTMLLHLDPPELGALLVQIRVSEKRLIASFRAQSPEAEALLRIHLPALHESLSQQGFEVQPIVITQASEGFSSHLGAGTGAFAQQHSASQGFTQDRQAAGPEETQTDMDRHRIAHWPAEQRPRLLDVMV